MSFSLLSTKLHCPPLPASEVPRPQLLAHLNQGLALGHTLTLVVAPAGFGKTTLISQWILDFRLPILDFGLNERARSGRDNPQSTIQNPKFCWLSLDEYDNDLALFLRYVVAAIQQCSPTACPHTVALLHAPQLPPLPHLVTTFLQDLAGLDHPLLLVLEDYHFIIEETIHQLLTRLIDQLPPSLHLVLTSRTEPPLPLARLRVRQRMTELRAAELCFSDAEAHALLAHTLNKAPTPETVTALQTETEGWAAGLQLAALSLRGRPDERAFVQAFQHSHRHGLEYLMEEVLARQSQAIQRFLLYTSILERFCVPLCEAVLSRGIGEWESERVGEIRGRGEEQYYPTPLPLLSYLIQANLFIVPLDEHGQWYRYHHLFRELLRHQLQTRTSVAEIAALHRQASAWLAEQGWIEEALQQALAAGDPVAAAHLVEQHWHELLNQQDLLTLKHWLALLPPGLVQRRPALLAVQAWLANAQGRMADLLPLAEQAEAGLVSIGAELDERTAQLLRGDIDAIWALVAYAKAYAPGDSPQLLEAAHRALTRVPVAHTFVYSTMIAGISYGYMLAGQPAQALRFLQEKLEQTPHQTDLFRVRLLFSFALVQLLTGNLLESCQTLRGLVTIATTNHFGFDLGWAYLVLGMIHYEWNELAAAHHQFAALVELGPAVSAFAALDGRFGLALTQQAQGQPAEAQVQVDSAFALVTAWRLDGLQTDLRSFQVRLLLRQGEVAAAIRQMEAITLRRPPGLMSKLEVSHLTQAKVLIAQASPASLQAASVLLHELWAVAAPLHNVWRMCEILALEALLAQTQGQTELALTTLARAVALAQPGRFIRTFVDLGPPLASLLYQLAAPRRLPGVETEYLGQVLAAFPPRPGADDLAQRIRQATQAQLIEPLTEREGEVLIHLHKGLANKAIAAALNISLLTVKRHIANLYQKLGVNSRQEALARARALGILPAAHE